MNNEKEEIQLKIVVSIKEIVLDKWYLSPFQTHNSEYKILKTTECIVHITCYFNNLLRMERLCVVFIRFVRSIYRYCFNLLLQKMVSYYPIVK